MKIQSLMESWGKFRRPRNILWASQQNGVFQHVKKMGVCFKMSKKLKKKQEITPCNSSEMIQISRSPEISNRS